MGEHLRVVINNDGDFMWMVSLVLLLWINNNIHYTNPRPACRRSGSSFDAISLFPYHTHILHDCFQNLSFGPANTSKIARAHNPPIHAYSIIRPHQPLPSLIRFNKLIRLPAASMPVALLSNPSVARFRISVSASNEVEKAVEEALRDCARASREAVRLVDSVSLWARRSACVLSLVVGVAVSGGLLGCFRFRSTDMGSSVAGAAGFLASGSCTAKGAVGACSPSISSSSSGP